MFDSLEEIDPRKMDNAQRMYIAEYVMEILKRDHAKQTLSKLKDRSEDSIVQSFSCVFGLRDARLLHESLVTKFKRKIE